MLFVQLASTRLALLALNALQVITHQEQVLPHARLAPKAVSQACLAKRNARNVEVANMHLP